MRFSLFLALVLAASTVGASASQHHKQVSPKPVPEKHSKSATGNVPVARDSASEQLKKIEQQTARSAGTSHQKAGQRVAPVRMQREQGNPPIRFSSSTAAGGGGMTQQGANPYRGRLRQKGSGRH